MENSSRFRFSSSFRDIIADVKYFSTCSASIFKFHLFVKLQTADDTDIINSTS